MAKANQFSKGYALVIGTGTNLSGELVDQYAATINDAEWIAGILREPNLCGFPEDHVVLLTGRAATRNRIITELDRIRGLVIDDPESTMVFFFSGHGIRRDDKSYLIPYGFRRNDNLTTGAIGGDLLHEKFKLMDSERILLLLNSCYSGSVIPKLGEGDQDEVDPRKASENVAPLTTKQIDNLARHKGFALLCAAQSSQQAETGYRPKSMASLKKYSPFTLGLSLGFSGKNKDSADGLVYFSDLAQACVAKVSKWTKDRQQPKFDFKGDNFAVGCRWNTRTKSRLMLGDDDFEVDVNFDEDDVVEGDGDDGEAAKEWEEEMRSLKEKERMRARARARDMERDENDRRAVVNSGAINVGMGNVFLGQNTFGSNADFSYNVNYNHRR